MEEGIGARQAEREGLISACLAYPTCRSTFHALFETAEVVRCSTIGDGNWPSADALAFGVGEPGS